MKVFCKETVLVQDKANKHKELFTIDHTYKVCEEAWFVDYFSLGEVTIIGNGNIERTFPQFEFEKYFKQVL